MAYQIVSIGAALVDTEISVTDQDLQQLKIEKGLMTLCDEDQQAHYIQYLREHIDKAHRASGGSAANSMIAASQLGCDVHMTCRVANDDDGHFFLEDLEKSGVAYNQAGQKMAGTTGKCLVMVTPDAERTMNTALAISEKLSPANVEPDVLTDADFLYIEGYLATSESGKAAAIKMREQARSQGTKITMSLSDPGIVEFFEPQLREMLGGKAQLLFCNQAEAFKWTGTRTLEEAIETLKQDTECFAITLGAKGAVCFDGAELHRVNAPQVKALDTNGAGDMFAGTFLAAINQGKSYPRAATLACTGASEVVTKIGPRLDSNGYRKLKQAFQVV